MYAFDGAFAGTEQGSNFTKALCGRPRAPGHVFKDGRYLGTSTWIQLPSDGITVAHEHGRFGGGGTEGCKEEAHEAAKAEPDDTVGDDEEGTRLSDRFYLSLIDLWII